MGALFKSRPLASLLMEKQFSIELCSLFTSAVFTNRSYYLIRIISANHPVCFQKAAIDDSIRKFPLKGQSCTNAAVRCSSVLQTVPLISLSQRHRAASKNCKCSQFWSGRGREISGCNTEKSARHQAAPRGSPQRLPGRELDWGVKLVPGRNNSALDETVAMLQTTRYWKDNTTFI